MKKLGVFSLIFLVLSVLVGGIFAMPLGLRSDALVEADFEVLRLKDEFERFGMFEEDLAAVSKDGKWGYVDKMGNLVIPAVYDIAEDFREGLGRVIRNGKCGFVDKKGKEVIPCIYDNTSSFQDGFARFIKYGENGSKSGFIDKTGKEIVPAAYDSVNLFSNGTARVWSDGKVGFIDKTGREVIPRIYTAAGETFHDGLVQASKDGEQGYGKWGYIDTSGKEVIPFVYDPPVIMPMTPPFFDVYNFDKGLARVKKDGKWGGIDTTGSEVIPFEYEYIDFFFGELAGVQKDGKWGFVNRSGQEIIPPTYDRAEAFSEGLACVRKDGKFGFIDTTGKLVVPLLYDEADRFSEGLARVKKDGKYGYVGISGAEMTAFRYDGAECFRNGFASVNRDGKYGFINKDGEEVIPCIYEYTSSRFVDGIVWARKDGKFGFLDEDGATVIPFVYDSARDFFEGFTVAKKDDARFILRYKNDFDILSEDNTADEASDSDLYLYDSYGGVDPSTLSFPKPESVKDSVTAVAAVNSAVEQLSDDKKASPAVTDVLALYAEEVIARAATEEFTGEIIDIDSADVDRLRLISEAVKKRSVETFVHSGIRMARSIRTDVVFRMKKTDVNANTDMNANENTDANTDMNANTDTNVNDGTNKGADIRKLTIRLDLSVPISGVDDIQVEDSSFSVSIPTEGFREYAETFGESFIIAVTTGQNHTRKNVIADDAQKKPDMQMEAKTETASGTEMEPEMKAGECADFYRVEFYKNTPSDGHSSEDAVERIEKPVKLSIPVTAGEPDFQAVFNAEGEVVGGNYNPVTNTVDVKIDKAGIYMVKENKKDFSDIGDKPAEMKEAIRILASKGVINGIGDGKFNPDGMITRAQTAVLLSRMLSKYDKDADGGFSDVHPNDYFFGAVGSVKRHGLMSGMSSTTFAPKDSVKKEQIASISARVLENEMKYKAAEDADELLSGYADASEISEWAKEGIALATREKLVVERKDGRFLPSGDVTRGEMAVILYRLYQKLR